VSQPCSMRRVLIASHDAVAMYQWPVFLPSGPLDRHCPVDRQARRACYQEHPGFFARAAHFLSRGEQEHRKETLFYPRVRYEPSAKQRESRSEMHTEGAFLIARRPGRHRPRPANRSCDGHHPKRERRSRRRHPCCCRAFPSDRYLPFGPDDRDRRLLFLAKVRVGFDVLAASPAGLFISLILVQQTSSVPVELRSVKGVHDDKGRALCNFALTQQTGIPLRQPGHHDHGCEVKLRFR
jgi:hypothetical protein